MSQSLEPLLAELTTDGGPEALISVHAETGDGRVLASYDADVAHDAASTIKLPLAMAAYRMHDRGELDLDAAVQVHEEFDSRVPGARYAMDPDYDQDPATWAEAGQEQTLRELVRRALVFSGNLATNLVLEQVGLDAVAQLMTEAGCSTGTVLARGITDGPAMDAGYANRATARDLAGLLLALDRGDLLGPAVSEALLGVLAGQTYRDAIPAGLPAGTWVANKTGWIDGVTHDAALVRPDGGASFALVVLTRLDIAHAEAERRIARIAAAVGGPA